LAGWQRSGDAELVRDAWPRVTADEVHEWWCKHDRVLAGGIRAHDPHAAGAHAEHQRLVGLARSPPPAAAGGCARTPAPRSLRDARGSARRAIGAGTRPRSRPASADRARVLVVPAGLTVATGTRTPVIWFRVCPFVLTGAAVLMVLASIVWRVRDREQRAPIASVPCRSNAAQARPFARAPPVGGVARRCTGCSSPSAQTVLPLGRG
jgi:hypothetical protein